MRRHSLCFRECPAPFEAPPDQWLAVPAYHVFGSDELAALSEPLRSLAARPYVGVSVADATELQVAEGQELGVTIDHEVFTLPARIRPPLPRGVVTVPVGLPGLEGLALPAWATLIISGLSRRTIGT
jgi:NADH-quinone oxidoreductase subunit G